MRDEEGYDGDAGTARERDEEGSRARAGSGGTARPASQRRAGRERERGESGDGCGGTAACNPADDDGAAGKRTMASPTPCSPAGSERADDVVVDALQPCRKRKGKRMGWGGGGGQRCSPA
ncbi:hypothetical protein ACLOJK_037960 [Asimina triloba]